MGEVTSLQRGGSLAKSHETSICHCFTSQKGGVREKLKVNCTHCIKTTVLSSWVIQSSPPFFPLPYLFYILLSSVPAFFIPVNHLPVCLPGPESAVLMKLFSLTLEAHEREGWATVNIASAKMNKKGQNK